MPPAIVADLAAPGFEPAESGAPGREPLADVVGADLYVPLVPDGTGRFVHLDYAASAPALRRVADRIEQFLPWYSSVHRGAGFTSTVSSEALAASRRTVEKFVRARHDDVVVFTRNTTDALNLLFAAIPSGTEVFTLDLEHHANLLPWRRGSVHHLPTPARLADVPARFDDALSRAPARHALVSVTGASNVTGELLPVAEIAEVAHRHGARLALDAAQLAPHRRIDVVGWAVDYVAFSGHKLYAPYGAGVLVGRRDWLDAAPPHLAGGGAVGNVTGTTVDWLPSPARHEGGTPNVIGAIALAAACEALDGIGFARIEAHDEALTERLLAGLGELPVRVLSAFDAADRLGIVTIALDGVSLGAAEAAAALSAEHGIATRDGAFCAHPLMRRLSGVGGDEPVPNALRVSVGLGSTLDDIDLFLDALRRLLSDGGRARYATIDGRLVPVPDPRPRPTFSPFLGPVERRTT